MIASPRQAGAGETPDPGTSFRDVIDKVDSGQKESAAAIGDLIAGRSHDVLSVVSDVAEADLSFKLLIGVRNKIIEAYKQTLNMQV
jgi:flagellar hook-basal body complex protein FliE